MAKKKTKELMTPTGQELLPEGLTLDDLKTYYWLAEQEYTKPRKRMKLLNGLDSGKLWQTINAQFPSYQILTDTNHVNEVKDAILNSVYTATKSAFMIPRNPEDVLIVQQLNSIIANVWELCNVGDRQLEAGERAALYNFGVTKVGFDKDKRGGTGRSMYKGDVTLENINPMKYMRDPNSKTLDGGTFCIEWDNYHQSVIKRLGYDKARVKMALNKETSGLEGEPTHGDKLRDGTRNPKSKYHKLFIYWVRHEGKIYEIHVLDNSHILYCKKTSLEVYPFAELYCNLPGDDIIGLSNPALIMSNSIAANVIESIGATHVLKQHRPPKFLNSQAGVNFATFMKYGNDIDKTFLTHMDASRAVHYAMPEPLPETAYALPGLLEQKIGKVSGVNDRYTGADTGSVTTTGGVQDMQTRASMRDSVKIRNYETYAKRLTKLIVENLIKFADKRKYANTDKTNNVTYVDIDFTKIADDIQFNYGINISTELPSNKMRLSQAADMLMEKQAQYGTQPEIITVEEWLMLKELPYELKDLMFSRVNIQRNSDISEQVAQTLFQFAGLVEQGVDPQQAMDQVIQSLQGQQDPQQQLGNTAKPEGQPGAPQVQPGSPQAKQMG